MSPAVACGNTVYLANRFIAWEPRVQVGRRASDCTGSCQVGRKSDLLPHCTRVRSTTTQTLSSRQEVIIQQPLHPHDSKALQQFALHYNVTYHTASASVSIWPRSLEHWWKACDFHYIFIDMAHGTNVFRSFITPYLFPDYSHSLTAIVYLASKINSAV